MAHPIRPYGRFNRIRQMAPMCTSCDTCFYLGPPESTTQTASRSVRPLLHSSRQRVLGNARACYFPVKIAPSHRGSRHISNTRFLWPTRVHNPNDRDAVWDAESCEPKKPRVRWGSDSPIRRGNFEVKGMPRHRRHSTARAVQKPLNRSRFRLGCGLG